MTSDEIKKVREAADIVLGRFGCHRADCRDCAKFVFSLVGTDEEKPVTIEWIREITGLDWRRIKEGHYEFGYYTLRHDRAGWWLSWDVSTWPRVITARYQFRLLAAELGIKRKGE